MHMGNLYMPVDRQRTLQSVTNLIASRPHCVSSKYAVEIACSLPQLAFILVFGLDSLYPVQALLVMLKRFPAW